MSISARFTIGSLTTALLFGSTLIPFSASAAPDLKKGAELFSQRCTTCHGAAGAGDGPVAQALPPEQKPRNLQEAKFKFATDDAKFKALMHDGGAAHGLNPLMPPQADLSDTDIESLSAFVHSLKK